LTRTAFLASPKPFVGHVGVIQRNAITSWTRLEPRPEIILFGDEAGTEAICNELSLTHVPVVDRNHRQTPLLNDLLSRAQRASSPDLFCFINSDILLLDDFTAAVDLAARRHKRFLMIGQRCDLDLREPLDFNTPEWSQAIRARAGHEGRLHGEDGIDYFVFTPGLFDPVPPLLVGRATIDNWLVYRARRGGHPVIDATSAVLAVHQNHDYAHHPEGRYGVYQGEEAQINLELAGGVSHLFWINDRTHKLTPQGLTRDLSLRQLRRHWDRQPVLASPLLRPLVMSLRYVQSVIGFVLRATGLRRPLAT
jgi:hypothetical protein